MSRSADTRPTDPERAAARRRTGALARLFARGRHDVAAPPPPAARVAFPGVSLPPSTDWAWRPNPWAVALTRAALPIDRRSIRLSADTEVFHDGEAIRARIEQVAPADAPAGQAPYGVALDLEAFDGSFLSLALEIPPGGIEGLRRRHLIGASLDLETDGTVQVFTRYNLRHGPNTETMLRELPRAGRAAGRETVEFDLAYTEMNEKRLDAAWLDVILEAPAGRRVVLRDLLLYRRPRAEL